MIVDTLLLSEIMTKENEQVNFLYIFKFWAPLSATWLMMAVEGPFLAAVIARLAEPKFNLAAWGVAHALAMIVESPIIMILSAAIALVNNRNSFLKTRNFTYSMNAAVTVLMLLLLIPQPFDFIAYDLINLPPGVARLVYYAIACFIPWPAAIGFRRFYQGILIRNKHTRLVAYGTIARLASMGATALLLSSSTKWHGAVIGAMSLSAGVVFEAFATWLMAQSVMKRYIDEDSVAEEKALRYRDIWNFYYPLAITSVIGMAISPMMTFFIGQSRYPLESLAVLPVVESLVFLFRSFGFSYQEVGVALLGDQQKNHRQLLNFAFLISALTISGLSLVAFTPLHEVWFVNVSGLSSGLADFAVIPTRLMVILPAFSVMLSFLRAVIMNSRMTNWITASTFIELVGILLVLVIALKFFNPVGAVAVAVAILIGRSLAALYLFIPYTIALKRAGKNVPLPGFVFARLR